MKGIKQHDKKDCGIACLVTIFRYYGMKISIGKLREFTRVDKNGVSLYALVETAKSFGFDAEALEGTSEELNESILNKEITFPFIAHVITKEKFEHFVIIERMNKNKIKVFDPATGSRTFLLDEFLKMWTGYVVKIAKSESFQKRNLKRGEYFKFFKIIFSQKKSLILTMIASLTISMISIISAMLYQKIIDNYILGNISTSNASSFLISFNEQLDILFSNMKSQFFAFIVLILVQAGIQILRNKWILCLSKTIDSTLIRGFYQKMMQLPLSFFHNRDTGEIISRFQDISDIRFLISGAGITLILDLCMTLAGGIILYTISPLLFALVIAIMFIYVIIVMFYSQPIRNGNRMVKESYTSMFSLLKETADGSETVKAFSGENVLFGKLINRSNQFLKKNYQLGILDTCMNAIVMAIESIGIILILWIGSNLVIHGKLTLGELIAFESLVYFFMTPIKELIQLLPTIQKTIVSLDRVNDIFEATSEFQLKNRNFTGELQWDTITLENVSFSYGYGSEVLNDIRLSFQRGKITSLIGESGSGKTTIAKLLLAFEITNLGKIKIDGIDIDKIPIEVIRKNVRYVSQNVFLFTGTIQENIMFGFEEENIEETLFLEVCKGCEVDDILDRNSVGYQYVVTENGKNLSGGQRQRITLARALVTRPKVLILDEATNQLDKAMEMRIITFIKKTYPDIIIIQIVHDLNLVHTCDNVISLSNGRVDFIGNAEDYFTKAEAKG